MLLELEPPPPHAAIPRARHRANPSSSSQRLRRPARTRPMVPNGSKHANRRPGLINSVTFIPDPPPTLTVNVIVGAAFALTKVVTVPGEHDAPPAPLQVRVTFWLNPLTAVKTTETGVGVPAVIAMVAVGGVNVNVGLVLVPLPPDVPLPVPVKVTVAGK